MIDNGIRELVTVVTGEVEALTAAEVKRFGCQPSPRGGIAASTHDGRTIVTVREFRERVTERQIRLRETRWRWVRNRLQALGPAATSDVGLCPKEANNE